MNNATTQCKVHRAIACWLEMHHSNVTIVDIQCNDNAIVHLKDHYDITAGCDLDMSLVGKLESWNLRHRVHQLVGANANTQLTVAAAAEPGDTHADDDCDPAFDGIASNVDCTAHHPPAPTPDDPGSSGLSAGAYAGIFGTLSAVVIFVAGKKMRGSNARRDGYGKVPDSYSQRMGYDPNTGRRKPPQTANVLQDIRF